MGDRVEPWAVTVELASLVCRGRRIIDQLSLAIPTGVAAGLIGRNGSGKTTLFRMLTGLARPTTGRVRVLGHEGAQQAIATRGLVGYVPERDGLYDDLQVSVILSHGARLLWPDDSVHQAAAVRTVLEKFDLADRADDWCGTLSAGLRRRVALARALVREPSLLLLDEVTNELDLPSRDSFYQWLWHYRAERPDATIVFATHNAWEATRICDFFIVLESGHALFCGPRDQLMAPDAGVEQFERRVRELVEQ